MSLDLKAEFAREWEVSPLRHLDNELIRATAFNWFMIGATVAYRDTARSDFGTERQETLPVERA
jgi:hypothetical protein